MLRIVATLGAVGIVSLAALQAPPQEAPGKDLYGRYCASCHGQTGVPTKLALATWTTIPVLSAPEFLAARSDDSLVAVTHAGVGKDMPARKDKLTREQLLEIARHVRSLGDKAPHDSR